MTVQNLTSVVIVTYFTGKILNQVIDSVLAQTANVELILVNNGNPPEVERALIAKYKDDPAVRMMTGHGNIGLARGYNLGARVAAGEHLLFLGHTCLIPENTVVKLYEQENIVRRTCVFGARLVDKTGAEVSASRRALLTPQTAMIEALRLYTYVPKQRLRLHRDPVPAKTVPVPALSRHFMFMTKSSFTMMRGFRESYFYGLEDMDFSYRLRTTGGCMAFVPDLVVLLRDPDGRRFDPVRELYKTKGLVHYFHENFGDSYFQPFLWGLYLFIWLRYGLRVLSARAFSFLALPRKAR